MHRAQQASRPRSATAAAQSSVRAVRALIRGVEADQLPGVALRQDVHAQAFAVLRSEVGLALDVDEAQALAPKAENAATESTDDQVQSDGRGDRVPADRRVQGLGLLAGQVPV